MEWMGKASIHCLVLFAVCLCSSQSLCNGPEGSHDGGSGHPGVNTDSVPDTSSHCQSSVSEQTARIQSGESMTPHSPACGVCVSEDPGRGRSAALDQIQDLCMAYGSLLGALPHTLG